MQGLTAAGLLMDEASLLAESFAQQSPGQVVCTWREAPCLL